MLPKSLWFGAVALTVAIATATPAAAERTLLNVSYDPTREFYQQYNDGFVADWKAKTGETLTLRMSHGGSGKQARSVIDGLRADVVTLALAYDIDEIAARTKLMPADWQSRLPNNSCPYTSTIVFLVRAGNPKGIHDWDDLAKPGIQVITPNPKTSGGARWNYLAAWGYALNKNNGDESKAAAFVGAIFKNVPVMDTGARGATNTFAYRNIGDVLIGWENEAFLAIREIGTDKLEMVVPSVSIIAEPPVAKLDGNAEKNGTTEIADAYLKNLYSDGAQKLIAKHYFRPAYPEKADPADRAQFAKLELFPLSKYFGSWTEAQKTHFSDGGMFDQIYSGAR